MRVIKAQEIVEAVETLCLKANFELRPDVLVALRKACRSEKNGRARRLLAAIVENAAIARQKKIAICQDTGLPAVFIEIGQQVRVQGSLKQAVIRGVEAGYRKGRLRASIVKNPLQRSAGGFAPAILHCDVVPGQRLAIDVLPKGFGCENKTQLKMFNPTTSLDEIRDFIIGAVRQAGPDACPPYVVGVGIGGTAEHACLLAKKALLGRVATSPRHRVTGPGVRLEQELLRQINKLGIGPMGLGGRTTALGVRVQICPTHIAGLPVCVSISCHALRSARAVL